MTTLFDPARFVKPARTRRPFGKGILPAVSHADRSWWAQASNRDTTCYEVIEPARDWDREAGEAEAQARLDAGIPLVLTAAQGLGSDPEPLSHSHPIHERTESMASRIKATMTRASKATPGAGFRALGVVHPGVHVGPAGAGQGPAIGRPTAEGCPKLP